MCVTMWREKALAQGDACCWSSVSRFLRKLTRVFLRTCLRLLTLLFPFSYFFALSGGFALFPRALFRDQRDGSFLLIFKCRRGGEKGEEPAGSVRLGGAQPEHRTRLSGLNGLGVGE